jgi:hypothetical protein
MVSVLKTGDPSKVRFRMYGLWLSCSTFANDQLTETESKIMSGLSDLFTKQGLNAVVAEMRAESSGFH